MKVIHHSRVHAVHCTLHVDTDSHSHSQHLPVMVGTFCILCLKLSNLVGLL